MALIDVSPVPNKPLLVLGKITEILDAFSLSEPSLTLGDLRSRTGLPTSTIQRLVANLVDQGFLDREGDGIRIGIKMASWAAPAKRGADTLSIIAPILRSLRDGTGETACFFREEQGQRVCVAMSETRHMLRREMHVGKILPLHLGSSGRVLMAWNPALEARILGNPTLLTGEAPSRTTEQLQLSIKETRSSGFAITVGEREDGASGISAPVFDAMSEVHGAISIHGPTLRMPWERCRESVELLLQSAEEATRLIGGRLPDRLR